MKAGEGTREGVVERGRAREGWPLRDGDTAQGGKRHREGEPSRGPDQLLGPLDTRSGCPHCCSHGLLHRTAALPAREHVHTATPRRKMSKGSGLQLLHFLSFFIIY